MLAPLTLTLDLARSERPDDPFAFRFAPQTYTLRRADGTLASLELGWSRALIADLDELRRPGHDPVLAQRIGDLLAAFLAPAGWSATARAIEGAEAEGRAVHLTLRSAAAELYALPWELLTLGTSGRRLGACPGLLLRYAWPGTRSAPEAPAPRPEGGRILFAWSAAGGAVPAADHQRALVAACQDAGYPFDPGRDILSHATLPKIQEALAAPGPPVHALHLLAHGGAVGSTFGLLLDGPQGDRLAVDGSQLQGALAPHAGRLRLCVLAACHGGDAGALGNHLGSLAQALHRGGLQAVVASRAPLSTAGSTALTDALYRDLVSLPASLEAAFLAARARLGGGDALSLQLYARPEDGDDTRPLVHRPYRGLLAFEARHARFFFGRDEERRELLADLADRLAHGKPRLLLIAGASGTGKSSVVLAGAIPDLLAGKGPDPAARWQVAVLRPGDAPLRALDEALAGRGDLAQPLALVVDQFEELFSQTADPAARSAFARRLWELARADTGVLCLVTLRIDFLGRLGELVVDDAGARLDTIAFDPAHLVLVPQMRPAQLRQVIEGPAAMVGLTLQEGLADRLLADAGAEPGALPLLQYTLDRLWEHRDGARLTLAAYDALGGVVGALQQRAESLIADLDPSQLQQARRLLLRLVDVGPQASAFTRRRVALAALRPAAAGEAAALDAVTRAFVDARLLVRGADGSVEVAHEALLRTWPRLHAWIDEDRQKLADLAKLDAWVALHREHGALLSAGQLALGAQIARRYPDELSPEAHALVDRSLRRAARLRRAAIAAVALIIALLVALALWFSRSADEAERAARSLAAVNDRLERAGAELSAEKRAAERALALGEARRLALAIDGQDPWRSALDLLLAVEAVRATDALGLPADGQALTALYAGVGRHPSSVRLDGSDAPLVDISASRDGRRIAALTELGTVLVWDVAAPARPRARPARAPHDLARLSPDGQSLLVHETGEEARVEAVDEGAPPRLLGSAHGLVDFTRDGEAVLALRGATLVVTPLRPDASPRELDLRTPDLEHDAATGLVIAREPGRVRLVDPAGERPERAVQLPGGARLVALHSDGQTLAALDDRGGLALHRPGAAPRPIAAPPGAVVDLLLAADARHLLARTESAELWLLDAAGEAPPRLLGEGVLRGSAGFSRDGRWIAVGDPGGRLTLRPTQGGRELHLVAHRDAVRRLAFIDRGDALVSAGDDNSARLWRLDVAVPRDLPLPVEARRLLTAPEGRVIAVGERAALVIDAEGRGEHLRLDTDAAITCADLDPAGARLLLALEDGALLRWDLAGPDPPIRSRHPVADGGRPCAAFDRRGQRLVAGIGGPRLEVHDLAAAAPPRVLELERPVLSARLTDDGRLVALDGEALRVWPADGGPPLARAGMRSAPADVDAPLVLAPGDGHALVLLYDGSIALWSLADAAPPRALARPDTYFERAVFTPDGAGLYAATGGGDLVRFSLADPAAAQLLAGHSARLDLLQFAADGRLVTAAADPRALVWPAADGAPARIDLDADLLAAALLEAPPRLALATPQGLEIWPLDPEPLLVAACDIAARNLTRAEWSTYLFTPYRSTCERWPAGE